MHYCSRSAFLLVAICGIMVADANGTFGDDQYRVTVDTGKYADTTNGGTGTDEHVFLLLVSDVGDVRRYLDNPDHNDFEKGSKDVFTFEAPAVSPKKVGVYLKRATNDENWQWKISYITIENLTRRKTVAHVHWDGWIDELDRAFWYDVETEKVSKEGAEPEEAEKDWHEIPDAGWYLQLTYKDSGVVIYQGPYKKWDMAEENYFAFGRQQEVYKAITRPFFSLERPESHTHLSLTKADSEKFYSARLSEKREWSPGYYIQKTQKWTGTREYSGPFKTLDLAGKELDHTSGLRFTHTSSATSREPYSWITKPFYWNRRPDSESNKFYSGLRFLP